MTPDPSRIFEAPLLKTKITVPFISSEYVHRPRLTKEVERGIAGPLTLLAAPAGFGKSHLLVEWARETHSSYAWLTLDSEDNDVSRFFHYLIGAFQTIQPDLGTEALEFIQSVRGSGLEMGLTLLINEIASLPQDIVLVMDDFQFLEDPTILQGIGFLLRNLPHNLHLIIASRSEPALDLAFLRSKGRITELCTDDLRFTSQEVKQFFHQTMGLDLPAGTVTALEQRTDGWITSLQMAAISFNHQEDPVALLENLQGDTHYLVEFLSEEVLDRQPEDIRQFLLRTSVLDLLNGSLCEAVVNPDAKPGYGTVMLNRLEHANLFIVALDEKHEWYRYHHLFSDFLRHIQAENNPAEIPVLQKRAALWFEKEGNLGEAFRYATASGDMEWAANMIERNIAELIRTGEIFTIARWISKMPEEYIHSHPALALAYAWISVANYQLEDASYWLDDVRAALNQIDHPEVALKANAEMIPIHPMKENELWNIRGGMAICRAIMAVISGNSEQAIEYSRQASGYLDEDNPFIHSLLALENSLYYVMSGDTCQAIEALHHTIQSARQTNNQLVLVIATCQLADMQALQGHLNLAWSTLQKAQYMVIGPEGKPLPMAGLVEVGFGEILIERDSLEDARDFLERGIKSTQPLWWISKLDGMVSLARLSQIEGDDLTMDEIMAEASHMALSTESSQWDDSIVSAIGVRLALASGDIASAMKWWRKSTFPDFTSEIHMENYPYHIYEYLLLTQVRMLIAVGKSQNNVHYLKRSAEILDNLLLGAERFKRVKSQIEILTLQAILQDTLGDLSTAKSTLLKALRLAEPEGYRRVFLDGGYPVAEILTVILQEPMISSDGLHFVAYVESLLAAFQTESNLQHGSEPAVRSIISEAAVPKSESNLAVNLSAREMEVLELIAQGKSNQEISAQLYLALNTVKRHAYNIYAKLGVNKRTQAISKARELGLIK